MKKNYIKPEIEITRYETEGMIAASGEQTMSISREENDIIDDGLDMLSKEHKSIWD